MGAQKGSANGVGTVFAFLLVSTFGERAVMHSVEFFGENLWKAEVKGGGVVPSVRGGTRIGLD